MFTDYFMFGIGLVLVSFWIGFGLERYLISHPFNIHLYAIYLYKYMDVLWQIYG